MQGKYKNKAYPLRIEEATLNAVKSIAEEEGRTANKQIEHILREYVKDRIKVSGHTEEEPKIKYAIATESLQPKEIIKHIRKIKVDGKPTQYLKVSKIDTRK